MKSVGMVLILVSLSSLAIAGATGVPEISPASGVAALTLISGALLVIRGRRKK
jgi:LPXTG-motif cell wall-anchored protein